MTIDNDSSASTTALASTAEAVKGKVPVVKKVCLWLFLLFLFLVLIFLSQTPEKRPEVRLLEYYDVPGMVFDHRLFFAQKVLNSAKRVKTSHPFVGGGPTSGKLVSLSLFWFRTYSFYF